MSIAAFLRRLQTVEQSGQIILDRPLHYPADLDHREQERVVPGRLFAADVADILLVRLHVPHHLLAKVVRQIQIAAFQNSLDDGSLSASFRSHTIFLAELLH